MEPNFLVIRQDRIGDVVLSLPMVMNLRKDFPGCRITVMLRNYSRDVYQSSPFVDEIISYENFNLSLSGIFRLGKLLRSKKFTHSIMPLPDKRLSFALFLAGIKIRISNGHKPYHFFTNTKSTYRRKYIQKRHESDYCADAVRKLGTEVSIKHAEIHLSPDEIQKARELKMKLCPNGELLAAVNSSCGNSSPNMPVEEYVRLSRLLVGTGAFKVLVTDRDVNSGFERLDGVYSLDDKNDLRELIIGIAASDLMVASSTGPMHIAGALGKRTVSVFCPLPACSPELWGPMGGEAEFVMPDAGYCGTVCSGKPSSCQFEGEGGITAEKIFARLTGSQYI